MEVLRKSKKNKLRRKTEENPGKFVRVRPNLTSDDGETSGISKKRKRENENNGETEENNKILDELDLERSCLISGINALFKILQHKKNDDNQLFDLDTPIFLQLGTFKVPVCPSRTLRLPLKHSLHTQDSTVCFIVSDVPGIIKKNHDKVTEHYENFFKEEGVNTKIDKIMSLHELKTEYSEFELKRKLLSTYDIFFVDGKISKYVSKHLGKIFRSKRRLPIPINLEHGMVKKMKYAMLRTALNLHGHGNTYIVQVGHCHMKIEEIYENILSVCVGLKNNFPGGWENIKAVNLKTDLSMAVPLYLSMKNPNEISIPNVKGKRPKAYKSYTGEISTRNNAKVTVYPSGNIIVEKLPPKKLKLSRK